MDCAVKVTGVVPFCVTESCDVWLFTSVSFTPSFCVGSSVTHHHHHHRQNRCRPQRPLCPRHNFNIWCYQYIYKLLNYTAVPDAMEICFVIVQYFLIQPKLIYTFRIQCRMGLGLLFTLCYTVVWHPAHILHYCRCTFYDCLCCCKRYIFFYWNEVVR